MCARRRGAEVPGAPVRRPGHGRVRAWCAPPQLHLASSQARCTVLRAVPSYSLLHPDRLFLDAEAPWAASEPPPPAAAASAAAALRLPLPPHRVSEQEEEGPVPSRCRSLQPAEAGACPARRPGRCRCVQPRRRRLPQPQANLGATSRGRAVELEEATKTGCRWGRRGGRGRRAAGAG